MGLVLVAADHVKSVKFHKKRINKLELCRPDDLFYPMKKYVRLFGHPSLPKNKNAGHRVSMVEGVRGQTALS